MVFANNMVFSIFFLLVVPLMCFSDNVYCSGRDTITSGNPVIDDGSDGLISAGGEFELGFFTPKPIEKSNSAANRRYVGIWYHDVTPRTVVWVANRDDPIPANSIGVLKIEGGNLHLLDSVTGDSFWNTKLENSSSANKIVKIMDSGNLVLGNITDVVAVSPMWQSFQTPTDTFIPGMMMGDNLKLTSWKAEDDPGTGNFTFKRYQGANQQFIISKKSTIYWKSGEPGKYFSSDDMTPELIYLLSNFSKTTDPYNLPTVLHLNYNYTRLVMNYTGELRALRWTEEKKQWLPFWSEPDNECSVVNRCGNFGSCNNNNWPFGCKCLPGFRPQSPEKWNIGDFSDGCSRVSETSSNDTFLSLKMLRVGEDSNLIDKNETECRKECLDDFECQAYSYAPLQNITRRDNHNPSTSPCLTWSTLNNLIEDYGNIGHILFVRVALSDIESTERDCEPCGTTLIPYPLSTGLNCGDPMYSGFNCNNSTGQLSFKGNDGTNFRVVRINMTTQRFVIQIQTKNVKNCDARSRDNNKQLNPTPPFNIIFIWCYVDDLGKFSSQVPSRVSNVEIGWNIPLEPICNTTGDCTGWPHSTCSPTKDGKRRCVCNTSYQWNGQTLNCTDGDKLQEPVLPENMSPRKHDPLFWILVAVLTSVICLVCISFIYIRRKKMNKRRDQINRARLDSERQVKELIDTSEFDEEDEKGLDVPFFDLQSIREATDNFSDANKLGEGGYGPVYKGKFAGGQEVAIKRLSRVSGQGLQEFKNEVVLIAKLQHRNLVRLRGYCLKGEEKILLYEYMSNKGLDSFIFDHAQSALLNWEMRFNIILGIARGLLYLHQDSRLRIIHRDLKTSNILLDEEMNPKISDFGLARIVGGKETEANTATVVGTYGYMSPEYALDGTFSVKSDVFSFGVVLLEIISGKKNTGFYQSKQTFSLLGYAWELWTENKVLDLMDKTLYESCNQKEFIKCVNVGLLCVQEDPIDRPTMSNVITLLDSEAVIPPIPKQPAFLIRRGNSSTASSSTKPETNSEITMTLEGR